MNPLGIVAGGAAVSDGVPERPEQDRSDSWGDDVPEQDVLCCGRRRSRLRAVQSWSAKKTRIRRAEATSSPSTCWRSRCCARGVDAAGHALQGLADVVKTVDRSAIPVSEHPACAVGAGVINCRADDVAPPRHVLERAVVIAVGGDVRDRDIEE